MPVNRRTFLAALLATAAAGPALRAADKDREKDKAPEDLKTGEWEKLGQKDVARKGEREVFEITSPNRFTALNFRVTGGDVEIEDVKVTFENDETFEPTNRLRIDKGEQTGKIDLPGKSRRIKRIRFVYRSVGGGKPGALQVLGKVGDTGKK
ncbi:MAG: hypothetical protein JWO31_2595 [Phycisphaerales bacterium]|nr:hypothetical protein [Phycisphaerales bacterium]